MVDFGRLAAAVLCTTVFACGGSDSALAAACGEAAVRGVSGGHWLVYDCDRGDGRPAAFYLAGAGGPEGFLYLPDARKTAIIDKLKAQGGNAIYFHAVRSHGGDGASSENPFVGGDPSKGVDEAVLAGWDATFDRMEAAGIALFFFLYDDGALPFGCETPLSDAERDYVGAIVSRFKDRQRLIWMTQEEFRKGGCADPEARQRALAAVIRANDPLHAIGVHHMNGQKMSFAGDPNIGVYAQQAGSGAWASVRSMHDAAGKMGWGDWVYVMAEAHPWHRDLLAGGNANRTVIRQSMWASAMAGGYVMLYDAFETHDPTDEMLNDLRRLQEFMESVDLAALSPNDAVAAADAVWALADPHDRVYVLYSNAAPRNMGVAGLPSGTYRLSWFDAADGTRVDETKQVDAAEATFAVPAQISSEAALYLRP